jgi:hypothetical protein
MADAAIAAGGGRQRLHPGARSWRSNLPSVPMALPFDVVIACGGHEQSMALAQSSIPGMIVRQCGCTARSAADAADGERNKPSAISRQLFLSLKADTWLITDEERNNHMDLSKLNIADPIVLVQLVVPLLSLFSAIVGWAIILRRRVSASRRWSSIPGRIITSELATRWTSGGSRSSGYRAYFPKVVYEYQVGGQVYQGNRIMFGQFPANSRPDEAQRKLAQYPLNSTGSVFYNPANPSESVLEQSAPSARILWIVAGILLMVILMALGLSLLLDKLIPTAVSEAYAVYIVG